MTASLTLAAPASNGVNLGERQSTDRLVFCHFMIGIVSDRTSASDYDDDMQRAKALGIDAFALNIGVDPYTDQQLGYAYQSAANNGMKVFISFDFNWYSPTSGASAVGSKIAQYANEPAQLKIDGKVFASSFAGDGLDVATMRSAAGVPVFWAPNFHPGQSDFSQIDGALNWLGWPNNGNNKAPTPGANVTVEEGDASYISALAGKPYIAPVSAWFSTHYGPEVSYSKNWVFPSDLLWYTRWNEVLTLGPQFLEIITWNDYGESHYIGPLSSPHYDDGNSKWTNDMPHDGWLDMAKPFIAAFHAGATSVDPYITSDQLIYWYRPTLRGLDCDATDTTMVAANNASGNYFEGRPNGWEDMEDSVFVVALLTSPGTVTVTSGGNTQSFNAPAGASAFQVDMQVGQQQFALTRGSTTVLSGVSLKDVSSICICGIYNFNAYVGSLPAGFSDPLAPDGLASLTAGLHVSTCSATPSLGTAPAAPITTPSVSTTSPGSPKTTSTTTSTTTPPPPVTSSSSSSPPAAPPTSTSSSAPSSPSSSGTCIAGTGSGNYVGLCSFCCNYGYCPPGPCTCTEYGTAIPAPPTTGTQGYPLPGEDDSYLGLCSFACNHGYCPSTACTTN
ncbi:carbohydrate-binding module family 24 protein [Amorphotheca resinae ATCC 22711]|uniref:Carbohydrate-binding module family 24 protein n=1 Tax=Amorphotheca resinae ATCC 22711 TaxID=857342 RepID=A0A2T3APT5_AMORE|nr:carbohydrate-binding module family 24 protein [Amorphotheca resinae ATCC 22711]PSS06984.1 carbohydrate-binding module family 24 protein [Amorphotheca resinae ATCC 22711]